MRPIQFNTGERIPNTSLCYISEAVRTDQKRRRAEFKCDCGNTIITDLNWVRFLNITSCGCVKAALVTEKNTKHSQASRSNKSGAYRSWQAMHQRVKVNPLYANRHICNRWCGEEGFANFYTDMGDRPKGLTIERVYNDGHYEPSNCIWATRLEQANNTTKTRKRP